MILIRLRPACADQQLRPHCPHPHFRGRPWQWPDRKDLYEAGIIDLFRVSTLDEAPRGVVRGSRCRTRPLVAWSETPRFERCRCVLNASRIPPCLCNSYYVIVFVLSYAKARSRPDARNMSRKRVYNYDSHARRAQQHSPQGVVSRWQCCKCR